MNKYYQIFTSNEIGSDILKENIRSMTFEDHFWHLACLSIYYKKNNNFEMQKRSLGSMCDLNYIFNALLYFDKCGVLNQNDKKYIKPFENKMNDEAVEKLIKEANKKARNKQMKSYFFYSFTTLLFLPLMLVLVFLFHMDTKTASVITIVGLLLSQTMISPLMRSNQTKREQRVIMKMTTEEREYFNYPNIFDRYLTSDKYKALIRCHTDEEREVIVDCIKHNKSLPVMNKESKKKKK